MNDSSVLSPQYASGEISPRMPIPEPRGPLSGAVLDVLTGQLPASAVSAREIASRHATGPIVTDPDAQLTLTLLYELHLRGIDGVDDEFGWDTGLLSVRSDLESRLVAELDELVGPIDDPGDVVAELWDVAASDDGPGLAKYLARTGTLEQFREIVTHRSLNQLREADLHTHAIPRLHGAAKAALVEIQADEYGGGDLEYMHSVLYARLMRALGLNDRYAYYIDHVPAVTLAALNTLSYLGLHRSRVGELVGHLSFVEMTSSLPSRDYSRGLRRLGVGAEARIFFDEHVEADSVHEQLVVRQVAGELGVSPTARVALIRGARWCAAVERLVAEHIWSCWQDGTTSLVPGRRA